MKTRIIRIGNSQGIRIPKPLLDQVGLSESADVDVAVQDDRIMIQPARRPRQGWDETFAAMAERGDDRLLDEEVLRFSEWDADEWEW